MVTSRTKTSFYRRLLVAHLIDNGIDTVPKLERELGMPRRTAQDTIRALDDLDITCKFVGANKDGNYRILDWGAINPGWVAAKIPEIRRVLGYQ